jgi:hypothetical protein
MRKVIGVCLAAVALVLPSTAAGTLKLVRVQGGFDNPIYLTAPRGAPSTVQYIVERPGTIKKRAGGTTTTFLDITGLVACCNGEQGLLSMAFHPSYGSNGLFYVAYTNGAGSIVVAEYHNQAGGPVLTRTLLTVPHPTYTNHNGGQLAFSRGGYLLASFGDGGSGGDPNENAQNMSTRLGKLVRINVGVNPAAIKIIGLGLRNPWRFSVDRATGDIYIADVGQNRYEEVDFWDRDRAGVQNFLWSRYEARSLYDASHALSSTGRHLWPIKWYDHGAGRCSITGGFVSRTAVARGRYFYADYCAGTVWSIQITNGHLVSSRREPFTVSNPASFGEDSIGRIYILSISGGTVYRIASK